MKFTSILTLNLLIIFGCKESVVFPDEVEISSKGKVITIHNRLKSKVYYSLIESGASATIYWCPRIDENTPTVYPQKSVNIDFENVFGFKNDSEKAIVYYWEAVNENGSLVPGNLHRVVVELH